MDRFSKFYCLNRSLFGKKPFCNSVQFWPDYSMVAHIFTLLFALFASKLVIYYRHSKTLNFRKLLKSPSFSFENVHFTNYKHFERLTVPRNNDQFGQKRCQNCDENLIYQTFEIFGWCILMYLSRLFWHICHLQKYVDFKFSLK